MSKAAIIQKQSVWLGGFSLTPHLSSLSLNLENEAIGAKTLHDTTQSYAAGLKMATAQFEGLYKPDDVDSWMFAGMDVTDDILTIPLVSTEEGSPAYFMQPMKGGLNYNGEVGQMFNFSVAGKVTKGDLCRGKIAHNATGVGADEISNALNLGNVPTGKNLVAVLHVFAVNSASDVLDVAIESDSADDFSGDEVTRLTFDTQQGVGSQMIEMAGPISDSFYRVNATVGGTSPAFDYAVVIAKV